MVVALLVFGPKRLPELARSLGRGMAEFRRASTDLRQTLQDAEPLTPPEPAEEILAPPSTPPDDAEPIAHAAEAPVGSGEEPDAGPAEPAEPTGEPRSETPTSSEERGSRSG